jgi:cystine transport system substrate-binding protein
MNALLSSALARRILHCAIVGAALALPAAGALAQADDSLSRLQSKGVVRVANTQTSPPWSFLGADNQPDGYDVVVAREIFKRIGVAKVEFVGDKFKNLVEGLNAQKYDVVVNSLARTEERAKVVDFTVPYTVQDFRIWVRKDNNSIVDRATLKGHSVGASSGTSNELWARNNLPGSEIRTYDNGGFLYNDLASGRLDSVIDSFFHGHQMQTVNNLPVKTVGEPLVYSLGAAAVPKNTPALRAAMDGAIQAMIADGTLQKFAHKYVGDDYDMVGNMQKATQQH